MTHLSVNAIFESKAGFRLTILTGDDLGYETQLYGLAVSAGVVSHTVVGGLTLGGGLGWISRKHGFSIDNLLSVEVVTAEGRLVTANRDENSDLFWGVRGGGNFDIVTGHHHPLRLVG